ncbi:hypothetical protein AB205_0070500 [Aquarana catesbeiana]|uniref:Secreted protein n=1 Tax=Aquarana catesbeiana TaxID=8400 RepID=A0A2G9Q8A0_AQUCT|nr:hypothetical protein AB205_0070500 [Aquarana catesbeiana]
MLHLGTLLKLTIVPYFQAMFPIYSSAIKSLCAKYTIFVLHRGGKTQRTPLIGGDQRPPTSGRRGNTPNTRAGGRRHGGNCHHNR